MQIVATILNNNKNARKSIFSFVILMVFVVVFDFVIVVVRIVVFRCDSTLLQRKTH